MLRHRTIALAKRKSRFFACSLTGRFFRSSCHRRDWKQTEYNPDSIRFQFKFLFASLAFEIIGRNVRRFVPIGVASDPGYIPDELGGTNPRGADPQPALVKTKHGAASAQNLSSFFAHLVEASHLFDLKSFAVGNNDVAIDCGEINSVPEKVAVVRPLHRDIGAGTGGRKAYSVTLLKAGDPDFAIKLKHVIGVRKCGLVVAILR